MSEEEKKAIEEQYKEGLVNLSNVIEPLINQFKVDYSLDIQQCRLIINYLLMERDFNEDYYDELDKEIEELKASHIMTHNKATNTEKAKIFDVIENSIDTYIEKSKPYWEQIMTKDKMTIDEALTIIDDMYQDRYKIMSQKTEKETIVDLGKMDYIKFTNLEWASVRVLREVQSLNHKFKKLEDKIKEILGIEENIDNEKLLSLLQTIVDENARLEDIEDRKVQIEYNNVFNKGVKSVEDKIKAKIEELNKEYEEYKDGQEWEIQDDIQAQISILEELLKGGKLSNE